MPQMYHLPLLPGYGPAVKVRSSVPAPSHTRRLSRMSQAEEDGYTGSYFIPGRSPERGFSHDGYIARSLTSSPPVDRRIRDLEEIEVEGEPRERERGFVVDTPLATQSPTLVPPPTAPVSEPRTPVATGDDAAEIVFFAYGVVVFFGFEEMQERDILEDVHGAGTVKGVRAEGEWEIEECHYAVSRPTLLSRRLNSARLSSVSMTRRLRLHAYITTSSVSVVPYRGNNSTQAAVGITSIQVAITPPHTFSLARAGAVDTPSSLRIPSAYNPQTSADASFATLSRAHGHSGTLAARRDAAHWKAL